MASETTKHLNDAYDSLRRALAEVEVREAKAGEGSTEQKKIMRLRRRIENSIADLRSAQSFITTTTLGE